MRGSGKAKHHHAAMGFGMVFVIGPVWIGENVRPELRGFFLCFTNGAIVLGQFILSYVILSARSLSRLTDFLKKLNHTL
jgi:hypothetical protein